MSSESRVVVVKLGPVEKHGDADTLGVTMVHGGYPCIVKLGEFAEGDLCLYVPVDMVVPASPEFVFLGDSRRIKARRLRGVFSMGLLVAAPTDAAEGDDLTDVLGFTKWEPPLPSVQQGQCPDERDGSGMPVYTDIEGLRRWGDVLAPGERVILTEKIHGECVMGNTRVTMADGSQRKISLVRVGDVVLGVDGGGHLTPTAVTTVFNNGTAEKWLKVTGTRGNAGRGNSYFAICCTPEHKFWSPRSKTFVAAGALCPGDAALMLRNQMGLTPVQQQVLLGKMLGDGSLAVRGNTALVQWKHRKPDEDYSDWTARALGTLVTEARCECTSGYGTPMVHRNTKMSHWILDKFVGMFDGGVKRVPEWVAEELTPLALAFWYMDDGSLAHIEGQEDRASFATCGYSDVDCGILVRGLARLGVTAVCHNYDGYNRLSLTADNAERLFLLVAPYIPPSMQRKLPERYRGHPGWLPSSTQEYKPTLVEQVVTSVEVATDVKSSKYDIETETHNYFASGILVHNSARFCWHNDRLWVGSHKRVKADDERSQWWRAARQHDLAAKLATVPDLVFFGETHGYTGGYPYGVERGKLALRIFDVWERGTRCYLDWELACEVVDRLGLPRVPVLFDGPWSSELRALAEGPSTLDPSHVREGIVVRPVVERWHHKLGRVVLKLHGEGFLVGRGKHSKEKRA